MGKKIAISGDHAGFFHKEKLMASLREAGHEVKDFGPFSADPADYPDFVHPLCKSVENGEFDFGVLICGSGQGVAMTANKHQTIRAALCWDTDLAEVARRHNNSNVICIAARWTSFELADAMVKKFLSVGFEGGRHQRRVDKINC